MRLLLTHPHLRVRPGAFQIAALTDLKRRRYGHAVGPVRDLRSRGWAQPRGGHRRPGRRCRLPAAGDAEPPQRFALQERFASIAV